MARVTGNKRIEVLAIMTATLNRAHLEKTGKGNRVAALQEAERILALVEESVTLQEKGGTL